MTNMETAPKHYEPSELLEGLDVQQRTAAQSVNGAVRISAVAGAGKTRTITRRIAYACATHAWEPNRVLAVTFSVKAAQEMRNRLTQLNVPGSVQAATFHSAALHQLREVWPIISDAPMPWVSDDLNDIVASAVQRLTNESHPDRMLVRDLAAEINWCKVGLIAPDDYERVASVMHRHLPEQFDAQRFATLYELYEREKTNRNQIDFNDILLLACHVIEDYEEAAKIIRQDIGWLTVDEYQDVSPLQHRLMKLWLGDTNTDVCVVGDPAQTIYSFAGATSWYLQQFSEEFNPLQADIKLATDYRSIDRIVRCANAVLRRAEDPSMYLRLEAVRKGSGRVTHSTFETDEQEAREIAAQIRRLVNRGASPNDFVVLTRINAQQHIVVNALHQEGLGTMVRSDAGWQYTALSDVEREDLEEQQQAKILQATTGAVTVSTIHASKGLEYKHAFIIGCSEGLIPFGQNLESDALEEERRLLYVGVTRAEDSLHFSYAKRKDESSTQYRTPSRFL
nr:ATP-dependent helicase [Bifidobacterium dolichotidis]